MSAVSEYDAASASGRSRRSPAEGPERSTEEDVDTSGVARANTSSRVQLVAGSARHVTLLIVAGLFGAALVMLATGLQPYQLGRVTSVLIMASAVVGLNVVTGYTGLLSVGHSAFLGLGAYTLGVMVVKLNFQPLFTIPVAVVLGILAGAVIGLPSVRIRGLYLAMVTLALAVAFPEIIQGTTRLTGGSAGLTVNVRFLRPPAWTGLSFAQLPIWMFLLSLATLLVSMLVVWFLLGSRLGRDMRAVRDHEAAAESFGVNVARTKIAAFAISGGITGLAGAVFAMNVGALSPTGSFTILKAIELLTALVLGGVATQLGPLVGAAVVVYLPVLMAGFVQGQGSGVLFGVLLILIVFLMPEGIVGRINLWWRSVVEFVPRGRPVGPRPDTAEP